ncbi:MAG TPA: DUF3891 family protein [Bacillales bacterium]|nr:DUF3891 family protein [Bacillales bacterium]
MGRKLKPYPIPKKWIMSIEGGEKLIVRESGNFYIFIRQHDHGLLSGEIAANWGNDPFQPPEHKLVLAASLHDVSWIEADARLPWNEEQNLPFDFTSYPLHKRLDMYEKGLNTTERLNPYGGLLTSMHYCSFFKQEEAEGIRRFLQHESARQDRLKQRFFGEPVETDLRLLQLWDNLSLYICLNRPGATKKEEHPWFKNGIKAAAKTGEAVTMQLRWLNERTVTVEPFPFRRSWSTRLPYSKARKSLGKKDPDIGKICYQHIRFIRA